MSDELRKLAEAALMDGQWADAETFIRRTHGEIQEPFASFIAAASPDVVRGLLDERDEAREAVKLLSVELERLADLVGDVDAKLIGEALADPGVRKIVGS